MYMEYLEKYLTCCRSSKQHSKFHIYFDIDIISDSNFYGWNAYTMTSCEQLTPRSNEERRHDSE